MLIEKLATSPTSRKMDFGEFIENCSMHLKDEDGDDLLIDGKEVAEELAKVLEKSDVREGQGRQSQVEERKITGISDAWG